MHAQLQGIMGTVYPLIFRQCKILRSNVKVSDRRPYNCHGQVEYPDEGGWVAYLTSRTQRVMVQLFVQRKQLKLHIKDKEGDVTIEYYCNDDEMEDRNGIRRRQDSSGN